MKEQIIEEAATELLWKKYPYHPSKDYGYWKDMFKEGAKWNEEIMIDFANWCRIHDKKFPNEVWTIQQLHTKYFDETYGSKGSDEHIVDINEMTSSQTEISDEEIEKQAKLYATQKTQLKRLSNREFDLAKNDYVNACKWYREQLKQKL